MSLRLPSLTPEAARLVYAVLVHELGHRAYTTSVTRPWGAPVAWHPELVAAQALRLRVALANGWNTATDVSINAALKEDK